MSDREDREDAFLAIGTSASGVTRPERDRTLRLVNNLGIVTVQSVSHRALARRHVSHTILDEVTMRKANRNGMATLVSSGMS